MRKIKFWALAPSGRLTTDREYDFSFYRDEDHFSQVVDDDLENWVEDLPVNGDVIDEYGWTDLTR